MWIALWAGIAMVFSDVFSALLTQAQARNRAQLAGLLDTGGWLVAIFTTSWSVAAVNGHDLTRKIVVLAAVSAANYVGSWLGTTMGKRWMHASEPPATRLGALEEWAKTRGYDSKVDYSRVDKQ